MKISELIKIIEKKILSQDCISNVKIEDKSFLHKNHKSNEKGKFHLNVNMNGRGAYEITENQVAHTQRESQSDYLYVGGSSAAKGTQDMRSYEAEYNQRNNDLKSSTIKGHLVQGNMNLFTGNIQQRNSVKEKYIDNSLSLIHI